MSRNHVAPSLPHFTSFNSGLQPSTDWEPFVGATMLRQISRLHFRTLSKPVVLRLYKHAEPLRNFPSFFQTSFLPIQQRVKKN